MIRNPRRLAAGMSLVELMIAMALGLLILAALSALFANSSSARQEIERTSRQIESGRFAVEMLTEDLRMAGFYGELFVAASPPGALPDPCSATPADWAAAMPLAVQGYDNGTGAPSCLPSDHKAGTDVLVIRRAASCEAGTTHCDPLTTGLPYIQVSRCSPENITTPYVLGLEGSATFNLRIRNCSTAAGKRRYFVRLYYVGTNNGYGVAVPTLKRREFNGTSWVTTDIMPLVEGIEELNIEYGIDGDGDGDPDDYAADPSSFTKAGCTTCTAPNNWANVVGARVHVLARNVEASPGYTDAKTYTLGRDSGGAEVTVTPGGNFRRHVYSGYARLVNVAQRREK